MWSGCVSFRWSGPLKSKYLSMWMLLTSSFKLRSTDFSCWIGCCGCINHCTVEWFSMYREERVVQCNTVSRCVKIDCFSFVPVSYHIWRQDITIIHIFRLNVHKVIPGYALPSQNIKDVSIAAAPIALLMDGMDGTVSFWTNSYWMCLRESTICFVAGVLAWVRDHPPFHFADIAGWHGHHTQHVFVEPAVYRTNMFDVHSTL